jgi:hypothetical protein
MGMSPRLLRPRATGFSPKSISGLLVWLDANDASSYTIATGISEWRDKSGNGRTFSQSTGNNQPVVSATKQNGMTLFEFDGTNDRLTATGNWLQIANCTLFAAFKRNSGAYGGIIASSGNFDNSPGLLIDSSSPVVRGYSNFSPGAAGSATTFQVMSGTVTNGDTVAFTNGTQSDSDAASGSLGSDQTTTSIGTYRTTAANYLNGLLGEVLAFSRVLTASERRTVEAYLGKKWGVTVA